MAFFAKVANLLAVMAVASAAPQFYPVSSLSSGLYPAPAAVAYHAPAPVAYHAPAVAVAAAPAPVVAYHAPAAVAVKSAEVPIQSQNFDLAADSSYNFNYQSADGSSRSESGAPYGAGVQGSYSYASPEGQVSVDYVADENGFQPSGNSVHPEIQKAVAEQVAFARSAPKLLAPAPAPVVKYVASPAPYQAQVVAAAYHAPVAAYHAPFVAAAPAVAAAPVAYAPYKA